MQDFYRRLIKDELYRYVVVKDSIGDLKLQLKELKDKRLSYGVAQYGVTSGVSSETNKEEMKIINLNCKISNLEKNISNSEELIEKMEKALGHLEPMEKEVLISLHGYRGRRDGRLEALIEKYHYEKSNLYKIANRCLEETSIRLYGDA